METESDYGVDVSRSLTGLRLASLGFVSSDVVADSRPRVCWCSVVRPLLLPTFFFSVRVCVWFVRVSLQVLFACSCCLVRVIGFDGLWYGVDGFAAGVMRVASVCVLADWISN